MLYDTTDPRYYQWTASQAELMRQMKYNSLEAKFEAHKARKGHIPLFTTSRISLAQDMQERADQVKRVFEDVSVHMMSTSMLLK